MEKQPEKRVEPRTSNLIQWVATFAVFTFTLQMGFGIGWASPNNARLLAGESPIKATPSSISWMTSIGSIGGILGAILVGILIEFIGSRRTILVTLLFMSVSWICLLVANSIVWLYASRAIFGIIAPVLFCSFSMYLGEVSEPRIRGTLIAFGNIGSSVGAVLGIVIETYLPMKVTSSMYLTVALLNMLLFFWLDDTPYYLVKKGCKEAAQVSLTFYRGASSEKEFKEIVNFVENNSEGLRDKLRKLRLGEVRKSLLVIMLVFALPHISGYLSILFYMEVILKNARFDALRPEEIVIYANVITVVSAFATFPLLDRLGRRVLLIVSSIGTGVALFALGLHFYLCAAGHDAANLQWLPTGSLVLYLIMYPIGYGSVPGVLLSEIFPENIKSVAVIAASWSAALAGFGVVKAYQPIVDSVGEAYVFWIYSFMSLLGVPSAMFLILETKGKTFQQIQDELSRK